MIYAIALIVGGIALLVGLSFWLLHLTFQREDQAQDEAYSTTHGRRLPPPPRPPRNPAYERKRPGTAQTARGMTKRS